MTTLTTFIRYCIGDFNQQNKARKWKENNEKEEAQLPLFSHDMGMYIENCQECAEKLLELKSVFSWMQIIKINFMSIF